MKVRWLRWLAVVPAALAAWAVVVATGLALHSVADGQCPPHLVVSGSCTAWWMPYATRAITVFCAGMAGGLIVAASALTAPWHRSAVAWTAFALGSCTAVAMAWAARAPGELITAELCGWLAARAIHRREGRLTRVT